jgi:uncharacterized membrane protein
MKFLGHSAHQVLIVFPVGLLITAVLFELIALATGTAQFWVVAYWLIAAGLIGGLAAAVFGILDYRRIPAGTRANRIGTLHGLGNAAVILLFAVSWWMRTAPDQAPTTNAMLLSLVGAALLLVTGWLGGELVDRLSIGVDERAHVDASNSMSEHGVVEPTTSYKRAA